MSFCFYPQNKRFVKCAKCDKVFETSSRIAKYCPGCRHAAHLDRMKVTNAKAAAKRKGVGA